MLEKNNIKTSGHWKTTRKSHRACKEKEKLLQGTDHP